MTDLKSRYEGARKTPQKSTQNVVNQTTANTETNLLEDCTPVAIEKIKDLFASAGITRYDPQCLLQVTDLAHYLSKWVLREAKSVSEFSGKKRLDRTDLDFALRAFNEKYPSRSQKSSALRSLAFERNRQALPPIRQNFGLRLPNDRFCQVQPNFEYSDSTDVNGKKHNLATAMDEADTEIEMDDYRSAEIDDIFAQQQHMDAPIPPDPSMSMNHFDLEPGPSTSNVATSNTFTQENVCLLLGGRKRPHPEDINDDDNFYD